MTAGQPRRKRGFRPVVLDVLRNINRNNRTMTKRWDHAPSLRYYDAGDGKGYTWQCDGRTRAEVPASEYVENQPEQLRRLIDFMVQTREDSQLIINMARARLAELEAKES